MFNEEAKLNVEIQCLTHDEALAVLEEVRRIVALNDTRKKIRTAKDLIEAVETMLYTLDDLLDR